MVWIILALIGLVGLWLIYRYKASKDIDSTLPISSSDLTLVAPVSGKVLPLSKSKDKAFHQNYLGKGIGLLSKDAIVRSPLSGKILMVFRTKHAISLRGHNGAFVLLHIGKDTIELNGEPFKLLVHDGQEVNKNDPLVQVDFEMIKNKGYDPTIFLMVTNFKDFAGIHFFDDQEVDQGQAIIQLEK